jgi:hypothetical protein
VIALLGVNYASLRYVNRFASKKLKELWTEYLDVQSKVHAERNEMKKRGEL